jgi:hypothetical protein
MTSGTNRQARERYSTVQVEHPWTGSIIPCTSLDLVVLAVISMASGEILSNLAKAQWLEMELMKL